MGKAEDREKNMDGSPPGRRGVGGDGLGADGLGADGLGGLALGGLGGLGGLGSRERCARERRACFVAFAALALAVLLALAMSAQDASRHRSLYEEYEYADALLENDDYAGAAEIYARLADAYPGSYVIEMKQCICALSFEDYETALFHAARAAELNPLLLLEESMRETLAACYEQLGDWESAGMLRAYGGTGEPS